MLEPVGDHLMSESELVKVASQGETWAISALLNQAFADREITVKVSLQSHCLRVLLESDRVPESKTAISLIQEKTTGSKERSHPISSGSWTGYRSQSNYLD